MKRTALDLLVILSVPVLTVFVTAFRANLVGSFALAFIVAFVYGWLSRSTNRFGWAIFLAFASDAALIGIGLLFVYERCGGQLNC